MRRKMCADLPAVGMRAKRRKVEAQAVVLQPEAENVDPSEPVALQPEAEPADPSEAQAVALQPEVENADLSEAPAVALQPEVDLAVQEQNKRLRVQKDCCLL